MISYEDFLKVDMRVGRVLKVEDFPKARNPSLNSRWTSAPKSVSSAPPPS